MPAVNKVGTQLLVSPHIKARAQALALIRHESMAEVYRAALERGGLNGLERSHASALSTMYAAFNLRGIDWTDGVEAMNRQKLKLNDDGSLPDAFQTEG